MDFKGVVKGLHHVTATVNGAQEDYDFYAKLLGLRLVKETVNFDNENVYHFYYGNAVGMPSTIFTTFPYKGEGVRAGIVGSGQVYETAFSVPPGALDFWRLRLMDHHYEVAEEQRFGRVVLYFEDPSGLKLSIMEDSQDNRQPVWAAPGIPQEYAILGIHNVMLAVINVTETIDFLEVLGYKIVKTDEIITLLETTEGGAGNSLVIMDADGLPKGVNGIGTVHHVAHRVGSIKDSLRIKAFLEENYGFQVTEVKDRKYFKSIYFRIHSGVLFEIATEGPGFLIDENPEELGSSLKLPDWQESRRSEIEANLEKYDK